MDQSFLLNIAALDQKGELVLKQKSLLSDMIFLGLLSLVSFMVPQLTEWKTAHEKSFFILFF